MTGISSEISVQMVSAPGLLERKKKLQGRAFLSDQILLSTLTWITEKELEREIKKNKEGKFSLEEKHEIFLRR